MSQLVPTEELKEKLKKQRGETIEAIKKMLEEGKSDDEIIAWLVKERPHIKNPKAYLRAAKSVSQKED